MEIHWKLFATLGEAAGETEVTVEVDDGATVADALDALFEAHPPIEAEACGEDGLYEHVRMLLEGEDIVDATQSDRAVEPGAELALFPPVSGG